MIWGIIGALDEEVRLIREKMEISRSEKIYGSEFYVGRLYDHDVVLVCCSVGKIAAAACASVLIREFHADAVINVGIAGAAGSGLGVLDVVLSSQVVFHDTVFSTEKFYPYTNCFDADPRLIKLAEQACETLPDRKFQYRVGRIATGDIFVESKELKDSIVKRFAPECVEMEGAAVGEIAHMNGKPFLVIRSMSDSAEDNANDLYDNFIETAANQSAAIIMNLIKLAPVDSL